MDWLLHHTIRRQHLGALLTLLLALIPIEIGSLRAQTPPDTFAGQPLVGFAAGSETVEAIVTRSAGLDPKITNNTPDPKRRIHRFGPKRLARDAQAISGGGGGSSEEPADPDPHTYHPSEPVESSPTGPSDLPAPGVQESLALSFLGTDHVEAGSLPPDSMGDVGPTQYIVAVNGRIKVFNKSGFHTAGVDLNIDGDVFFDSVRNAKRTSDPRIRFDRLSNRWYILIINVDIPNRVLVAVSDGPTVLTSTQFSYYYFPHNTVEPAGNNGCLADYPTLGLDGVALYVGVNMFCGPTLATSTFDSSATFVIPKAQLLSGLPTGSQLSATAFRSLSSALVDGIYTPQGVDNPDPAPQFGYFIGVGTREFSRLYLHRISNPGGLTPTISSAILIPTAPTNLPLRVPHKGNSIPGSGELDATDDRLFMAQIRNGGLWTAHNIGVVASGVANPNGIANRNATRWYEVVDYSTVNPTIAQSGTIFDSAATNPLSYWMPSINVNGQGHALIGMSVAGANAFANAAYARRLAGDPLGTFSAPVTYTNSSSAYNPAGDPGGINGRRWGDYSYTSLDPCDNMTMWTVQEYTSSTNNWGVQVAKVLAPPPATPIVFQPNILPLGQSAVTVTVTGAMIAGSGFYDPGPGYSCRITATLGTLPVSRVTYLSPTQIQLVVSTIGASSGPVTPTIRNPDGQVAPSGAPTVSVPIVSSLIPLSTTVGSGPIVLSLAGSGFLSDTVIIWNGLPLSTTVVGTGLLTTVIPASFLTVAGTVQVASFTPSIPLTTTSQPFTIFNLGPVLTSVVPAELLARSSGLTFTITGTNFLTGAIASVNGITRPTTVVSRTLVRVAVPPGDLAAVGTLTFTVANPSPTLPSNAIAARVVKFQLFVPGAFDGAASFPTVPAASLKPPDHRGH